MGLNNAKVLVPVKGAKADEEAIKLACSLAKKSKSKVYITYVIEVERSLPLNAEVEPEVIKKGEEALDRAERIAEEQDYEVETELLQAREAGPAIVTDAIERDIKLIIIGIDYKKQFGEFTLGETVPYVLKNAPCYVLLYREPIPPENGSNNKT
jgi:nucleotide-binding universal stress UspA family protein